MQRSSVDLPEPEAPISAIASCSPTTRSMPLQHLVLAVGLGDAAQLEDRCSSRPEGEHARRARAGCAPQLVDDTGQRDRHAQVQRRRGEQRRVVEVLAA